MLFLVCFNLVILFILVGNGKWGGRFGRKFRYRCGLRIFGGKREIGRGA